MALNDDEMAEQALQGIGVIEEGDEATASDMIEAKYKAVNGKFESGIQGMEQAPVLDILAQLRISLGNFEEVALLRFVVT
ncbi:unnamed protein product [Sphagnum balticum]